jgi:hypothetical protein
MPGLNDILQQNPNIMRSVQEAAMNQMAQNPQNQQDPAFQMMQQGMNQMGQRGMNAPAPNFGQMMGQMGSSGPMPSNMNANDNEMMGPSGVDDILAQLDRTTNITPPPRTPTPPQVNVTKRKPALGKKKQGGIAIDL